MIRALTIPTAVAALAVTATPALAGTSNFSSEPTANGGGRPSSSHVAISLGDGRLSTRFSWRNPNPRREQEFQLLQAQLAEAGYPEDL
jgi:hypothetical protein